MTDEIFEQVRVYLPKYLSPTQTRELYDALRQFPNLPTFYLPPATSDGDLLQGDGWRGFIVSEFHGNRRKIVAGIILSNSCDIDTQNTSHLPRRILFCPLISLYEYERALIHEGLGATQIANILQDIRRQRITDIFYLPGGPYGPTESMALLDDVHPHPLADFKNKERTRMFRLHQSAFYVFVVKLSIHFCRLQEKVSRFSHEAQGAA